MLLNSVIFFSIQPHLSWELIASFSFCLRLDNTPAAWWNGAESGPVLFACPKACLWLGMELKTKPCATLCSYKHTHAQRNYFMCRFFVPTEEIHASLAELDSLLMIPSSCLPWQTQVMRWMLWPTAAHLGSEASIYTTELKWYE